MAHDIQRIIAKKPLDCATVTAGLSGDGSAWKLRLVLASSEGARGGVAAGMHGGAAVTGVVADDRPAEIHPVHREMRCGNLAATQPRHLPASSTVRPVTWAPHCRYEVRVGRRQPPRIAFDRP